MEKKPTIGLDLDEAAKLPLRENETRALHGWAADPKAAPVAPETAAKMFGLFLRGYSCREIQQQESFKGFTHGAIVHARVVGRWDEAAAELRDRFRRSMIDQAFHVGQEAGRVVLDVLACANKHIGEKARAYLAGETNELPLPIAGVSQYRALVDLYVQLQDGKEPPKLPAGDGKPDAAAEGKSERGSDQDDLRSWAVQAKGSARVRPVEA